MEHDFFDIAIVGGSLTGASLACALAESSHCAGLRIALVEPGPEPAAYSGEDFDPRVVALTRQSQRFLAGLGVWESVAAERICPYARMYVWDGEGTGHVEFNSREVGEADLGHIVENSVVLRALLRRIEGLPQVHLFRGRKVEQIFNGFVGEAERSPGSTSPRSTLVLDDGETMDVTLVLAADGGQSKMRELLAMKTREWDYGQQAIVATVRTEMPHEFTAWQRFSHTGPLAFLPLRTAAGDAHFSSIVWSQDRAEVPRLMDMDDDTFGGALGSAFEHRLGRIERIDQRFHFPLRQRHAIDYVQPGFALLGDAAHTIHPLAGQGVNLGLRDVQVFAAEVERAMQRRIPLADYSILRRYARSRKGENLAMMAAMEGFKRLFASRRPSVQVLRNLGMRQVDSMAPLKKLIARQAMGISPLSPWI